MWLFQCACGNFKSIRVSDVRARKTTSCGCHQKQRARETQMKHGMAHERLYHIYNHMKQRCTNPNDAKYPRYGGRGIKICERWQNFESFVLDMEESPGPGYSLGRIDNDGDYEPANCRWETALQQANNRGGKFCRTIPLSLPLED